MILAIFGGSYAQSGVVFAPENLVNCLNPKDEV
jgi:hypothetical protein